LGDVGGVIVDDLSLPLSLKSSFGNGVADIGSFVAKKPLLSHLLGYQARHLIPRREDFDLTLFNAYQSGMVRQATIIFP
jgi:hypothetical protein